MKIIIAECLNEMFKTVMSRVSCSAYYNTHVRRHPTSLMMIFALNTHVEYYNQTFIV